MVADCTLELNAQQHRFVGNLLRAIQRGDSVQLDELYESANAINDGDWPDVASLIETIKESSAKLAINTSGTSGNATTIWYRPQQLIRGIKVSADRTADVWGLSYPLTNFAGLQVLFQALLNNNLIVNLHGLDSRAANEAIRKNGVTHLSATPTWYRMLTLDRRVHSCVRQVTFGGERLDPVTLAIVRRCFPHARTTNIYASTEVGTLLVSDSHIFDIPNRLKDQVKIVDSRLLVHRSLLADPDRVVLQDEFFDTGDLVKVKSQDPFQFQFEGRDSEFIVVGGQNVNPHRVEHCIIGLPDVLEVLVYAVPNSVTGNLIGCDVVLRPECTLDGAAIQSLLADQLPPFEVPRIIQIVSEIQCNLSGKKIRR